MVARGPVLPSRPASSRWVLAAGVSAGPGVGARNVALAVRSGWHEATPLSFAEGTVLGVRSPALPLDDPRHERIRALAVQALRDASGRLDLGPLPLVLALPQPFTDEDLGDPSALAREIGAQAESLVDTRAVTAFTGERAVALALARALDLLEQDKSPAVIVGAVDSLVTPAGIAAMVAKGRVTPSGWQGGPANGGVMPGEGAAFVVLSKNAAHKSRALAELSQTAAEEQSPHDVEPLLLSCLERACSEQESVWLASDVTGEAASIIALGDALRELKARRQKEQPLAIRHEEVLGCLGDLGVATLFVTWAMGVVTLSLGAVGEDAMVIAHGVGEPFVQTLTVRAAGLFPMPPSQRAWRTTGFTDLARALGPLAFEWAREVARSLHLLPPRMQTELTSKRRAIAELCNDVTEGPINDALMLRVTELESLARGFERDLQRAARSLSRRGKESAADLEIVRREAALLADRAKRERSSVLAAVARASADAPPLPDQGFVLSQGVPAPLALPFAPGRVLDPTRSPLGADEAEDEQTSDEEEDATGDEPEDPTAELGEQLSPLPEAPSPVAPPNEILESVASALEVVSSGWRLRRPPSDVPWSPYLADVDRGILRHLDWLHALVRPRSEGGASDGGSSVAADLRGHDSPTDPGLAFASALVLSCSTDPRLVRAAVQKARGAPSDLQRAYADALSLSSSPNVDGCLRELCVAGDRASVAVALEVMARRRHAMAATVLPLVYHPDADVRVAAARALSFARDSGRAIAIIESRMSIETDHLVVAEMLVALLRLRSPFAEQSLARVTADALAKKSPDARTRAARLTMLSACAALGREQELGHFLMVAREPEEIATLGWFGRVTCVPELLEWLTSRDDDERRAAGRALARILGLVLDETKTSAKLVTGNLVAVHEDALVVDTELYRTYWQRESKSFDPRAKYRFGKAFDPQQAKRELVARALQRDRRQCELELALTTPGVVCRDVEDWTSAQLHALGSVA